MDYTGTVEDEVDRLQSNLAKHWINTTSFVLTLKSDGKESAEFGSFAANGPANFFPADFRRGPKIRRIRLMAAARRSGHHRPCLVIQPTDIPGSLD